MDCTRRATKCDTTQRPVSTRCEDDLGTERLNALTSIRNRDYACLDPCKIEAHRHDGIRNMDARSAENQRCPNSPQTAISGKQHSLWSSAAASGNLSTTSERFSSTWNPQRDGGPRPRKRPTGEGSKAFGESFPGNSREISRKLIGISRETNYAVILHVWTLPGNFPETFFSFPEKKNVFHRNLFPCFTGIFFRVPTSHFVSIGPGGRSWDLILGTQTFWTASQHRWCQCGITGAV